MSVSIANPPARRATRRRNGQRSRRPKRPFAESKCGSCIALCCRYFALEIDKPQRPEDFDDLRWYLLHDRTQIFTEGRSWFVQVFNKCSWLGDDGSCQGYDQRPSICREYESKWCDQDETKGGSGEPDPDLSFRTLAELEAYRDAWVKRWKLRDSKRRREAALRGVRKRRREKREDARR